MITPACTRPCFELVYSNGEPVDTGDCIPHFPDHASAAQAAPGYRVTGDVPSPINGETPIPQQLPVGCVVISCDGCGYLIDEDDATTHHFLPEETAGAIQAWEWTSTGDHTLCPGCVTDKNTTYQLAGR